MPSITECFLSQKERYLPKITIIAFTRIVIGDLMQNNSDLKHYVRQLVFLRILFFLLYQK